MTGLTLRQIETFATVVKAGGMTRAAEVLETSQPSVSRIVAELEMFVGRKLFDRVGRKLLPTEAGRALFHEVERSFLGLAHLEAAALSIGQGRGERLDVLISPSLVALVTQTLLVDFARSNPDVVLALEIEATLQTFVDQLVREGDIGITVEPIASHALTVTPIGSSKAVCLLPRGIRGFGTSSAVNAADLDGVRMVSFRPDSVFRQQVDRVLAKAGAVPIRVAEARTTAAVCQLAASLKAAAIIPAAGLDPVAGGRLAMRPFLPVIASDILLARPAHRPASPAAERFIDRLGQLREEGWPANLAREAA